MHKFLIRQNGQTVNEINADSAEEALALNDTPMTEMDAEVVNAIMVYRLNFINYGTTYGFSTPTHTVAIQEVSQ